MTLPFRPIPPQARKQTPRFDRAAAKADGYTDAEIDEFLASQGDDPFKPTTSAVPRESTVTPATAPTNVRGWNDVPSAARAFVRGIPGGTLEDEIEAGIRAPFSDRSYTDIRDNIRADTKRFKAEQPGLDAGANIAGAVVSGKGLLKLFGGAPAAINTAVGRTLAAGGTSAATGFVAGAGDAEGDVWDRAKSGVKTGALAALVGSALQGGGEIGSQAWKWLRGASGAPDAAGVSRISTLLKKSGKSTKDLRDWSDAADPSDILAEGIGPRGVSALGSANRLGHTAPEAIKTTLDKRAAGAGEAVAKKVESLTGVRPRDAKAFADEAMDAVEADVKKLYAQAKAMPDVESPEIAEVAYDLTHFKSGRAALERAAELARGKNTLQDLTADNPAVSVANLQNLREGIDYAIEQAKKNADDQMVRFLTGHRKTVDTVLKKAGGAAQEQADALYAGAIGKGESFALGERVASGQHVSSGTAEGVTRTAAGARDADAFRAGSATALHKKMAQKGDGSAGNVTNPVTFLNSPAGRAQARTAFQSDEDFGQVETMAKRIGQQLQNRTEALYGSQTAGRLASDAEQLGESMAPLASVAKGNIKDAVFAQIGKGLTAARRRAVGAELDAASKFLLAGGPDQMSRADALSRIESLLPSIQQKRVRGLVAKALLSGQAASMTMER